MVELKWEGSKCELWPRRFKCLIFTVDLFQLSFVDVRRPLPTHSWLHFLASWPGSTKTLYWPRFASSILDKWAVMCPFFITLQNLLYLIKRIHPWLVAEACFLFRPFWHSRVWQTSDTFWGLQLLLILLNTLIRPYLAQAECWKKRLSGHRLNCL